MSKPTVFVIGASGNIGSATVRSLASNYEDKVKIKAGVRNPERAELLKNLPGVVVVQATMGEEKLTKTFLGVSTLYIVSPTSDNRVSLVNSTADSAVKAGVKHIAVVSTPGADVPEFTLGKHFFDIEKHVAGLGIPYTFIRLPVFFENVFAFKGFIAAQNVIYYSLNPKIRFGSVAVEDAGEASAAILANPSQHSDKKITLISDFQSYNDIVRELSSALGREISYIQRPVEVLFKRSGYPGWQVTGLLEFVTMINKSNPAFVKGKVSTYTDITGKPPTTLKEWVAKNSSFFK